jgi:hypothetical protein
MAGVNEGEALIVDASTTQSKWPPDRNRPIRVHVGEAKTCAMATEVLRRGHVFRELSCPRWRGHGTLHSCL